MMGGMKSIGGKRVAQEPPRSRYARALEQAPELLATLNDVSASELNLNGEVALARTLLESILVQLGDMHARTGMLSPLVAQGVSSMLAQVQSLVRDAAAIEAKRDDQRISATHMLTLLVALRDDLKRRLNMAFGDVAAQLVEDTFNNARWTGGLREEDVADALLEPAAFELKLRIVDREGDALREAARTRALTDPEMLALGSSDVDATSADPLSSEHVVDEPAPA